MKALKIIFCGALLAIAARAAIADESIAERLLRPGTTSKDGPEWWTSLGDYRKRDMPVYFGACLNTYYKVDVHGRRTADGFGKSIIFFAQQSTQGSYVTMNARSNGRPDGPAAGLNGGRISLGRRVVMEGVWQGGQPEVGAFQVTAEYLLRKRLLKLVQPKDFASAIDAPAQNACPNDQDYDAWGLDAYYKARGWNTPTPLPGH